MNQLIFEELKLDFEEHIKAEALKAKESCYRQQAKQLDGVKEYALCVKNAQKRLEQIEKKGKYRILFMELGSRNPESFNLVQNVVSFIEEYKLDRNNSLQL